jgi:uncharacterized protein involved in outer membrane biogenesis
MKKLLMGVLVVAVILLVAVVFFAGPVVKGAVNGAGPRLLGVPVSVQHVQVSLLTGRFGLRELVVGNPKGFSTPSAMRLGEVAVDIRMGSLFSKVMVIERVLIKEPEITYESGLNGSNIGAIQKLLESKSGETAPAPVPGSTKAGKKVQINDLSIEGGRVLLSAEGMAGRALAVPLPPVHLKDIGKESGGASPQEVLARVFGSLGDAVKSAGTGIGKGVEAVGKGVTDAGKTIGGEAKAAGAGAIKAVKGLGGLLKNEGK